MIFSTHAVHCKQPVDRSLGKRPVGRSVGRSSVFIGFHARWQAASPRDRRRPTYLGDAWNPPRLRASARVPVTTGVITGVDGLD